MKNLEYLDIVSEDGKLTGEILDRETIHVKGCLHRHVHVWIYNSKGQVLLQKRAKNKKTYASIWAMSAEGHVKSGETPDQTAYDEVAEELSVRLDVDLFKTEFQYIRGIVRFNESCIENGINIVYLVPNDSSVSEIVIQKDEVAEVKWMDILDYQKELDSNNREYRHYDMEWPRVKEIIAWRSAAW